MKKNNEKKPAHAFIQEHYREPRTTDPIRRWLPHPDVARGICGALAAYGVPKRDLEDALQDVYVRALEVFRRIPPPKELAHMRVFCRKIARDLAIDRARRADVRRHDFLGNCENPDDYTPLEYGAEQRDPVDARRQLEALAELFREGRMPEGGLDILEGVASRCTYGEIDQDHGIGEELVRWRLREMRRIYRTRMARARREKSSRAPKKVPPEIATCAVKRVKTARPTAAARRQLASEERRRHDASKQSASSASQPAASSTQKSSS